jgi:hypothetical protein
MKAILEFNLPEEREEHKAAVNAMRVLANIEDLDNMIREVIKYDDKWLHDAMTKEGGISADTAAIVFRRLLNELTSNSE